MATATQPTVTLKNIAADMAEKVAIFADAFDRIAHRGGDEPNRIVAAHEAVVVVERFEVVEVGVDHRPRFAGFETPAHFVFDRDVAAQPGQRLER